MQSVTTTQAIELFKTALEGNNHSPKTVRAYISDILQFTVWLATESVSADDPQTIARFEIKKFLGNLAKKAPTGKTSYRKVVAIKKFFVFLKENGVVKSNVAEEIIPPLKEKRLPHVLKKNEYKALLFEAEKNPRDYAIIQTILQTGLRVSEVTNLTIGDIDLPNKTLTVRRVKGAWRPPVLALTYLETLRRIEAWLVLTWLAHRSVSFFGPEKQRAGAVVF